MLKTMIKQAMPQRAWTWLRLMRMQRELRRYETHQIERSYSGFPLKVWLSDPMAEGWYGAGWPELPEIAMLKLHGLKMGATVFDLGAHQCVVALILSRLVGSAGRVIAVEANAHNVEAAQRNRQLNHVSQLEVIHAAVAEKSGRLVFNCGLNGGVDDGTGQWGRIEVPALSIDDLACRYGTPNVLFVDIEGFEVHALRGASHVLACRPDCFVELHLGGKLETFGGSAETILQFFPGDRFELYLAADPSDGYSFVPISNATEVPNHRCFLIALGRRGAAG